ncbi:hypothetical protein D0C36_21740 [Mucilaginibacter conchicola]|uniref:TonB-dependent receptor plug domain-containing protein n=1 Tax=Mucilaginibacter conchicola TaxID=2303333 RepID=A0A372NP70_9SPHI|nr:hypothetical protein [Mucilaginibacter conchicola]RFZ90417.1 hypothetical protein D0C36_21740 [Mucilaginibacter conchicola]
MKYLFAATLLLLGFTTNAQGINKQAIDTWLVKCDTSYKASKISGYAFNKIVYEPKDSVKFNNDLQSLKSTELLSIDPFWNEELLPTTDKPGKLMVLIVKKGEQTPAIKQSTLKLAISRYAPQKTGTSPATKPVLIINGQPVSPTDSYAKLSNLKIESITDIYYSKHPVPAEYYGPTAKNGIVAVWTK